MTKGIAVMQRRILIVLDSSAQMESLGLLYRFSLMVTPPTEKVEWLVMFRLYDWDVGNLGIYFMVVIWRLGRTTFGLIFHSTN